MAVLCVEFDRAAHLVFSLKPWHDEAMGEIVNLRRVKKALARDEAAHRAAENRAQHGMTNGEREAEAKRRALLRAAVDGAELPKQLPTRER